VQDVGFWLSLTRHIGEIPICQFATQWPLLAQSGHAAAVPACPLSGDEWKCSRSCEDQFGLHGHPGT